MLENLKKSSVVISTFCLLFIFVICSCNTNYSSNDSPEFAISKPIIKNGVIDNCCQLGGVFFDFYNKSNIAVTYIETKMNIFDKTTEENAFTGTGTITSEMNCLIESGVTKSLCISLDEYITVISDSELLVDQFYVSTIHYADGTVWNDYAGMYATSSE